MDSALSTSDGTISGCWYPGNSQKNRARRKKAGELMIFRRFLLAVMLVLLTATVASARMVSVNGSKTNLRSGPGTNYAILWELGKGYPLRVIDSRDGWLKVVDFENDEGWVSGKLVSRNPHVIVKKNRINIRSGPGTGYKLVGQANYGVVFRTLESRSGWVKIRHENGMTGWVQRSLLWGW
jgi:SH3-like domain-containing protein